MAVVVASGISAEAATINFNLSNDFSANNPNGSWSYVFSGSPLVNVGAPVNTSNGVHPNSLTSAVSTTQGYFSTGNDLNVNTPDVIKTIENGGLATGANGTYTNGDFLAGDVIVHSPNDGTPLAIIYTAQSSGTLSFTTDIWYAHTVLNSDDVNTIVRSNSDSVSLGGTTFDELITPTSYGDRSNGWVTSETNVAVTAGEQLIVDIASTPGQQFGSLNGVEISGVLTTSAVPEPSTWAMLLIGFAGLGFAGFRQHRSAKLA